MPAIPNPFRKRMTDVLTWLLTFVMTGYAALVLILFVGQRHLLYHTRGSLPAADATDVAMREVAIATADGLTLVAWYAPPAHTPAPVVLHFHGNSGSIAHRTDKAQTLMAAGFGVLLLEYRGFAGNPGRPTEDGLYEDARGAMRWLATQGIAADRVVLYGESLGTGVAVQIASETTPAGIILEAPYTSIPDVAALQYPFVPVHWLTLDRYDSLAKIGRVTAPLLLIHGERDGLIPITLAKRLFAAAAEPKQAVFVPQASHDDLFSWGAGEAMVSFVTALPVPTLRP